VTRPNEKEFFRLDERDFRLPAFRTPAHDQIRLAALAVAPARFLATPAPSIQVASFGDCSWLWKNFEGTRRDDA
jgi:hypothetical protein